MKGILSIFSGIRIIKAPFVPEDSIVVGEKMFERFKLAFPEAQQDNIVDLQTTTNTPSDEIISLCIGCVKENCSHRSEISCCPVTVCAMRQAK